MTNFPLLKVDLGILEPKDDRFIGNSLLKRNFSKICPLFHLFRAFTTNFEQNSNFIIIAKISCYNYLY